jgi:hypothetical protein
MTAGEGSFTLEHSHYDMVPSNIQADIVAAYKRAKNPQAASESARSKASTSTRHKKSS